MKAAVPAESYVIHLSSASLSLNIIFSSFQPAQWLLLAVEVVGQHSCMENVKSVVETIVHRIIFPLKH